MLFFVRQTPIVYHVYNLKLVRHCAYHFRGKGAISRTQLQTHQSTLFSKERPYKTIIVLVYWPCCVKGSIHYDALPWVFDYFYILLAGIFLKISVKKNRSLQKSEVLLPAEETFSGTVWPDRPRSGHQPLYIYNFCNYIFNI
jgi:hypothetical protein